jgi:phenylpropionate dioxygenase-like ring-hydroxylating dioxygenase large terminal subunit
VDNYNGFIFACLSDHGPSLVEHLGNARPFLDAIAGQGDNGIFVNTGAHKYRYDANWKLQLENTLDNYHVMFVHESFMALIGKRTGRKINMSTNSQWRSLYLGGGHGAIDFSSTGGVGASTFEDIPFNLVVFPNLAFVGVHIRTIRPISVDETEVSLYPTLLNGGHDEVNSARLRKHEEFFGPAGFGAPDDVEVAMGRVRRGLNAKGNNSLLLARGLNSETVSDDGTRVGRITDEGHLRGLYSHWKQLLKSS